MSTKKEHKFSKFYYWIVRNTETWLIKLLRIRVKKNNFDKIPDEKCLFILNHNSNFDPMLLIEVIKKVPMICVSKPENFKIPVAGPFIHHAGFISLNRDDTKEAVKAINKASNILEGDVGHVCIFPEGTRNKTDSPLLPFHPGSFKIATKSSSTIVVIDLKNTKKIKKNIPFKHTTVEMNVVAILKEEDYQDLSTQEIATLCSSKILEDYLK